MKDRILRLLERKGLWMSAGAISRHLKENKRTVLEHLKKLEEEKILKTIDAEILIVRNTLFENSEKLQVIKMYKINNSKGE